MPTRSRCSRHAHAGQGPTQEPAPRRCADTELGPGEAIVAVMASAINYNTVWGLDLRADAHLQVPERYGRLSPLAKRHDLPYHVVGSDLAGVVLRTGPGSSCGSQATRSSRTAVRRTGELGRP